VFWGVIAIGMADFFMQIVGMHFFLTDLAFEAGIRLILCDFLGRYLR
jgi:hypothetical protein